MINQALAAFSALVLVPFGSVTTLLEKSNPWHGFESGVETEKANLLIARAERWKSPHPEKSCKGWIKALLDQKPGVQLEFPETGAKGFGKKLHDIWAPWTEEELQGVRACEEEPCSVKLGPTEVAELKKVEPKARLGKYLELVARRSENYVKTEERKEYEFPGKIVDPWKYFEARGFKAALPRPERGALWIRKLEFAPDQAKTLHQVIDRRTVISKDLMSATIWVRDAYTDHYFDSWGEWTTFHCDAQGAVILQALFLELDLLKKDDLISKIMRGKMRSASEEQGIRYLERSLAPVRKAF